MEEKTCVKMINLRIDYVEKEMEKATQSLDKRLEIMNEFRSALKDQNTTFITRNEYESKHLMLENKLEMLQKLVYIGVGACIVIEIALRYLLK